MTSPNDWNQRIIQECRANGGKVGSPTNPAWYHNLVANPQATIEVGTETVDVSATVTTCAERVRLYATQPKLYPGFAEYAGMTSRRIPVAALTRRPG
jgi:deazaflavin-dependent oxidoreductase (nitroreductase family)